MTDYPKEQVTAFPDRMIDPKIGLIVMNYMQTMFQGYLEGKVPRDTYNYYSKAWDDYDEKILSRKPIRSYILIAIGHDAAGNTMVVADANANNDFSDDPAWILTPDHKEEHIVPVDVQYDRYADGKIYREKRPLIIDTEFIRPDGTYLMCFADYATFEKDGRTIGVVGNLLSEPDEYYDVWPVKGETLEASVGTALKAGEYLTIDGDYYKILGMNTERDMMRFEKMESGKKIYSTQEGMEPFPFSGKDIITGKEISLADYRGKYLFIDIWSRGCGPCIAEMPALAKVYGMLDKSKIEFLSIVEEDNSSAVRKIIEQKGLAWPQIMNSKNNDIFKLYGINKYPTTFFIAPDGKIIMKDTHAFNMVSELRKLGLITIEEHIKTMKDVFGRDITIRPPASPSIEEQ